MAAYSVGDFSAPNKACLRTYAELMVESLAFDTCAKAFSVLTAFVSSTPRRRSTATYTIRVNVVTDYKANPCTSQLPEEDQPWRNSLQQTTVGWLQFYKLKVLYVLLISQWPPRNGIYTLWTSSSSFSWRMTSPWTSTTRSPIWLTVSRRE